MAGRPRTTLKRLDEMLQKAADYWGDLSKLLPEKYRHLPTASDPIHAAWRAALTAAGDNHEALMALRIKVAEKVERADQLAAIREKGRR